MRGLVAACAALLFLFAAEAEARRVALVVANSRYEAISRLATPEGDAALIARKLASAGFSVTSAHDLSLGAQQRALVDFRRHSRGAEVAIIYFAGHGVQAQGINYLLPTDSAPNSTDEIPFMATPLSLFLRAVDGANTRIVILDACRNNPIAEDRSGRVGGTRPSSVGLDGVESAGALVMFSAQSGRVAYDRGRNPNAPNSPFATALAARLTEPGLDLARLGAAVTADVLAETASLQNGPQVVQFVDRRSAATAVYIVPRTPQQQQVDEELATVVAAARAKATVAREQAADAADVRTMALNAETRARQNAGGPLIVRAYPVPTTDLATGTYAGGWANGYRNGYGVFRFDAPESLRGDFVAARYASDQRVGPGWYGFNTAGRTGEHSVHFAGEFIDDRPNGLGETQFLAPHGVYHGEHKDWLRDGVGVHTYADGRTFTGQWRWNAPHGLGVLQAPGGAVLAQGRWSCGVLGVHRLARPREFERCTRESTPG